MQGTQGGCSPQRVWGPLSFLFTQTHSRDLYPLCCHTMGHPPLPALPQTYPSVAGQGDDLRSIIPHPPHPRAAASSASLSDTLAPEKPPPTPGAPPRARKAVTIPLTPSKLFI